MGWKVLEKFFAKNLVFTYEEFVAFLNSEGTRSRKTREMHLRYFVKKGRIMRVRRGLYCVVPPDVDPVDCPVDAFLLTSKMTDDAVLAYHTALEFHGAAYSLHNRFLYLTARRPRQIEFREYHFRGVLFPKILRDVKKETFNVKTAERAGLDVKVTNLERTLVDVLDRPYLGGGWEEIWRSLEMVEFFNLDQVVEYALLLKNATTVAKVGFFLEQHQEPLMVDEVYLERLREQRPRKPLYMERGDRKAGHFVPDWNLVVPDSVFRRSWVELV